MKIFLCLLCVCLYYCKLMFGTVSIPSKEFPLSQLQNISPTFLHTSLCVCVCVCVRKVTGVWQLERGKQNGSCSDTTLHVASSQFALRQCSVFCLQRMNDQSFCVLMCSDCNALSDKFVFRASWIKLTWIMNLWCSLSFVTSHGSFYQWLPMVKATFGRWICWET